MDDDARLDAAHDAPLEDPTAEASSTALVVRHPAPLIAPRAERVMISEPDAFRLVVDRTLDAVDEVADMVAQGLGLRDR